MPSITIRVFEGELTWGQAAELVDHVTEVVVPFVSEPVRSSVWLLVEKVSRRRSHRLSGTHGPLFIGTFVQ